MSMSKAKPDTVLVPGGRGTEEESITTRRVHKMCRGLLYGPNRGQGGGKDHNRCSQKKNGGTVVEKVHRRRLPENGNPKANGESRTHHIRGSLN